MLFHKCKNSVFCACFFFFFLLGTICGAFAFFCLPPTAACLPEQGAREPGVSVSLSIAWSLLRPVCVVLVFALHPQGHRAVFPLVFLRGFLTTYCFAVSVSGGGAMCWLFVKELITLTVFFVTSKWVYFRWAPSSFY